MFYVLVGFTPKSVEDMAIIKGSIFGQIQKRVGNEVGYVVGKRNLLRSWNPNPVNPRTPEQQKNRNWLYVLIEQYQKLKHTNFIKYQYKNKGETQQTTFCRLNKNAVEWDEVNRKHVIVFEKLLLSKGNVNQLPNPRILDVYGNYVVTWDSPNNTPAEDRQDTVNMIVVDIVSGLCVLEVIDVAKRMYWSFSLNGIVHGLYGIYLSVRKKNGTVSNSQYLFWNYSV